MKFAITERGSFRRCKRQVVMTSKNGAHLTRMFSPLNLSLGSMWHRAQQLWVTQPDKPLTQHARDAAVEATDRMILRYEQQVGAKPSDNELSTTYEAVEMLLAMAEMYEVKWVTPLPPEYKLLSAEQKIEVEVPGTEHPCDTCRDGCGYIITNEYSIRCQACNGTGTQRHILQARLDGLVQHITGRIDVLERKSYGQRPRLETLNEQDQFIGYVWVVKQLGVNSHLDSCIAYDGMWRRDKVPRGRTFDDLFSRYTLVRTPQELAEFERMLPIELNQMAALYQTVGKDYAHSEAYINRPWNGCTDCGMRALCVATSRGEDTSVMLRTQYTTRTDDVDTETPGEATDG